jgi:hypothetical protein
MMCRLGIKWSFKVSFIPKLTKGPFAKCMGVESESPQPAQTPCVSLLYTRTGTMLAGRGCSDSLRRLGGKISGKVGSTKQQGPPATCICVIRESPHSCNMHLCQQGTSHDRLGSPLPNTSAWRPRRPPGRLIRPGGLGGRGGKGPRPTPTPSR